MSKTHQAFLSLGSNIQPHINLVKAIQLLQQYGRLEKISNAWESESVGAQGPNYLNACVLLITPLTRADLKEQILLPIEAQLGRTRSADKFAARPIDIDIVVFDEELCDNKYWEQAFVVVPLAEIHPKYKHPRTHESVMGAATRLRTDLWMEARRDVLAQFGGNTSTA